MKSSAKKIAALIIVIMHFGNLTRAQNFSYFLTKDSTSYTALYGATTLISNESFTNKCFTIHIPFQFNFCGTTTDSCQIETNGFMIFNRASELALITYHDFSSKKDTLQNYASSISYATTGTSGNRILMIEFKNVAQNVLSNADHLNYQVWLYENANKVEVHTGPNSYAADSIGTPALIGVINRNMDTENKAYLISGAPSSPSGQLITGDDVSLSYIDNIPSSGIVYTLTPSF